MTSVCLVQQNDLEKLKKTGVGVINSENILTDLFEKPLQPKTHFGVPPFYIFKKADVEKLDKYISLNNNTDSLGEFIKYLCRKTKIKAFLSDFVCYDVGNVGSYLEAKKIWDKEKMI